MDRVMRRMSKAVKQCGRMILKADRSGMQIDSKSGCANFVTEYDKKVQDMLRCKLAKILPDALFIGEEAGGKVTTVEGDEVSLDKGCSILARGSGVLV